MSIASEPVAPPAAPPPKLDPAKLSVRIEPLALDGKTPHGVAMTFDVPIAPPHRVGKTSPDTNLVFSPQVTGSIRIDTAFSYTFLPSERFLPGRTYTARLEAVETKDGVLSSPAWRTSFQTPGFALISIEPRVVDPLKGKVEAQILFSGPVAPRALAKHMSFKYDGDKVASTKFERGKTNDSAIVQIELGAIATEGDGLVAELDGELSMEGYKKIFAAATSRSVPLRYGKPMEIAFARVVQTREGSAIEIRCDDHAVEARRSTYDYRGEWIETSARCELSEEDAAAAVHLDPPVKFAIGGAQFGFRILGDFKAGKTKLHIDAGARTIDEGVLLTPFSTEVDIQPRNPNVAFAVSGRYLPRSAWSNLPITHVNANSPSLVVRRVPPANLVYWMSDEASELADERKSDLVLSEPLTLNARPDELTTTWIDLGAKLPRSTKGLLEVSIVSIGAPVARARILLTDLHLVVKRNAGGRELSAWALDASTMKPLGGASLELVERSGRVVARCTSDSESPCVLRVPDKRVPGDTAEPFAVLARHGDDLTYLKFSELKTEVTETAIAGEPYLSARAYRAAIYTDRGVYRPADTVHVVAIARDVEGFAPPAGMPVTIELVDPRNRVAKKLALDTNAAGVVSFDHPFPPFAATGKYRVVLKVADAVIQESAIQVEEFVPERMKVGVEMSKVHYLRSEPIEVAVNARYLFGSTPAGSRVEVVCRLEPAVFEAKNDTVHNFGVWRSPLEVAKPIELGTITGELDKNGTGTFGCPSLTELGAQKGAAKVRADVSVFEAASGRTTHAEAGAFVHDEKFYLGLGGPSGRVHAGEEVHVSGVVVDWTGTPIGAVPVVDVEFVRLELDYQYWYDERGSATYRNNLRPVTVARKKAEVRGGEFSADFRVDAEAIGFLVRARAGATESAIQLAGNLAGEWELAPIEQRADVTPRPDRPAWIAISSAETIAAGEKAEIRFRAPYRGTALLTIETDRVVSSEWKEIEAGDQTWTFAIDRFVPNVYASVFVLKDPHLESSEAFLPDRAFGVRSIAVEPSRFHQPLVLSVPKEVRSNSELTVEVELTGESVEGPAFLTIAAVDEGILSLTKFQTPNPLAQIFGRRALGVETFETIGWSMVLPPGGPSAKTGGDTGESGTLGRVQPVKPVALWSGVLEVPAGGKLKVTLPVPQYRGALRVMAVAATRTRMGKADAMVTVRDPIVVQSTLPRFMSAGDEAEVPVFITNLSGAKRELTVTIGAENLPVPGMRSPPDEPSPVKIVGEATKKLTLADKAAGTVVFELRALKHSGAAKLKVRASASAKNFVVEDELDVPLLPAGPRSRVVQKVELEEGKREVSGFLTGWVPTSEKTTFWVTASPYGEVFDHLKYLLRYPYG